MKILRFNEGRWGILEGELVLETDGPGGNPTGRRYDLAAVRLLVPATPSKIVCVGRNYREHIREMGHDFGQDLPKEPGLFLKAPNTLAHPGNPRDPWNTGDAVPYPFFTQELHYEGELAVVIGDRMRNVPPEKALDHVLGYTIAVDITARDAQRQDLQWVRAKSADKFLPLGPWIETDLDPQNTWVRTYVNDQLRQEGHTSAMIFGVAEILSYISSFMTLEPMDVVLTGTPEGVGALQPGDRLEVAVEGIGTLHTRIGPKEERPW
ncbi:fumarylacetoacetate hydrolase family protein [Thermus amyloliquefaciens]|uniref:fumarylacetoacetate hydrolase family protein n=1 Tax=Thermus amyloliquefaciens TaxID=1449080 RepID=UPI0005715359|nr:fumarylacetoacetate hydrolase family protein [Thermus amyloliquefaciens]